MNDPEIISESDFQSESWSTTTVYDAVYEEDNTENEVANVMQGDIIEEHGNVTEAEEVNEENDENYEEFMPQNKNMREVQTHENAIEEEVYEEYDGDSQKNMPRYATYSNKTKSITPKFLTKKILVSLVLLIVCTVGVGIVQFVVWLSVHFTKPTPTTTVATTTSVSITTTVTSFKMASARGTVFSIKSNKLNV